MSKTIFGQGTIVTPEVANAWQNPVFVSRADVLSSVSQLDLNDGEIFIPQIDPVKDLVTEETLTSKVISPDGVGGVQFREIWGGAVEVPVTGTVGTIGIPVTILGGTIIDVFGVPATWLDTVMEIPFGSTQFIYVDDTGALNMSLTLPPRQIPHTALAELTASGVAITNYVDLRPHVYVNAHNDTPQDLVNTGTITGNYTASAFERVIVNTTGGSFALTLPENPRDGDRVAFVDIYGQFGENPLVLSPFRISGVAQYTISDTDDDWLFSAPYSYIELAFVENDNTWVFLSIPDTTCKNRGTFIRCGGTVPEFTNQAPCEAAGYDWASATSQCFRFGDTGVYADGLGGNLEIPNDYRCKETTIENKGLFLRCDGTTAVYSEGDDPLLTSDEYTVTNAPRCGGSASGRFVRCEASTASFGGMDAIYEDGVGGTYRVHSDERCVNHRQGRFVRCANPGEVNFGNQTVPVGIYENGPVEGDFDYFFDDPRCRDIAGSAATSGRFAKCDGNDGLYQASSDGSLFRRVAYDPRCLQQDKLGDLKMSIKTTNHGPWIKCDGTLYSVATNPQYAQLRTLINGSSGSDTFIVPDFRDKSPFGAAVDAQLLDEIGANNHILTTAQMPNHTHNATVPEHDHTITVAPHNHAATSPAHDHDVSDPGHTHTFNAGSHNHILTMSPHTHSGQTGAHAHGGSIINHTHTHTPVPHQHDMTHLHDIPGHNHRLWVWYAPGDSNDSVDSLNRESAIAGEVEDSGTSEHSYQTFNGIGNQLVENSPTLITADIIRPGFPPEQQNWTGTVVTEDINNLGETSPSGAQGFVTTNTNAPLEINNATTTGVASSTGISGTTGQKIANISVQNESVDVTIFNTTTTATASTKAEENIVTTSAGSSASFSLIHHCVKVNFFIHA